jgi:hypothetical protein
MSTQRRVALKQRFAFTGKTGTKFTGIAVPSPVGAGNKVQDSQFRRVAMDLTASSFRLEGMELATNSLSLDRRCKWRFCHGIKGLDGSQGRSSTPHGWSGTGGSSPARTGFPAGHLSQQLPLISPLLSGNSEREQRSAPRSARSMQSALPQVLTGVCPRTERQHGQGNLYLQHAARNAACDSGRRSARGDLLRA